MIGENDFPTAVVLLEAVKKLKFFWKLLELARKFIKLAIGKFKKKEIKNLDVFLLSDASVFLARHGPRSFFIRGKPRHWSMGIPVDLRDPGRAVNPQRVAEDRQCPIEKQNCQIRPREGWEFNFGRPGNRLSHQNAHIHAKGVNNFTQPFFQ